jgi:succinate dehydrogenase / fumarate reductase, cytochrome b subunit
VTATQQPPDLSPDITSPTVNQPVKRGRFPLLDLYQSAVGKKWVMAITGIALMGYVFAHMVGNLKMYIGPEDLNHYGEFLRELLVPILPRTVALWLMRGGLTVAFVLHIHAAYSLTIMNRRARLESYSTRDYIAVSFAARTMRWSGIIISLFLVWHLADLTWGVEAVNPDFERGMPYENLAASLSRIPVAVLYIVANIALGLHLYHGTWSIFQTMGSMSPRFNPRHNPLRRGFAAGFAIIVAGINITFPLAVMFGVVAVNGGAA